MRRKYDVRSVGRLIKFMDEYGAHAFKSFHDKAVVHDFMPHEDRCSVLFESKLDDSDCPLDSGTKATRTREQKL